MTINVLLTLLSDSVLAGVGAFVFSTIVITLFGEIFLRKLILRAMPCAWERGWHRC